MRVKCCTFQSFEAKPLYNCIYKYGQQHLSKYILIGSQMLPIISPFLLCLQIQIRILGFGLAKSNTERLGSYPSYIYTSFSHSSYIHLSILHPSLINPSSNHPQDIQSLSFIHNFFYFFIHLTSTLTQKHFRPYSPRISSPDPIFHIVPFLMSICISQIFLIIH